MRIAITGHRPDKLGHDYDLKSPLLMRLRREIIHKVAVLRLENKFPVNTVFITGMALGVDTLFAEIAIDLKIPFIAAIPFVGQHLRWPFKSREKYNSLLAKATEIVNVSGDDQYKPEYMQLRNMWMVDNCDHLIAIWDGSSGGTANCVRYAQGKKPIIQINPKHIVL